MTNDLPEMNPKRAEGGGGSSCVIFKKVNLVGLTFDEHPKKVGQVEVVQENDDDARSFVGLAPVQLLKPTK
jgi:hypothetical protein